MCVYAENKGSKARVNSHVIGSDSSYNFWVKKDKNSMKGAKINPRKHHIWLRYLILFEQTPTRILS